MRYFLLLALVFFSLTLSAQRNFVPGRIIQISGDTLSGYIENRDWRMNPDKIKFRDEHNAVLEYSALDIRGFYLTGSNELYRGAAILVDKTSLREGDVLKNHNVRGVQLDTAFFSVLVQGKLSLYYLYDEFARRHFIAGKDTVLQELRVEKRRVLTPSEGVITIDHFKLQLAELMSDCPAGPISAAETSYTDKSLKQIVSRYNSCFPGGGEFVAKRARIKSAFGFTAGVNYSQLRVNGSAYSAAMSRRYDADFGIIAGICYEIIVPRSRDSWMIYFDMVYRYYNMEDIFKASQIKIGTTLRYKLPIGGSTRPFLGFGMTNAFAIASTSPKLLLVTTLPREEHFRAHEQGLAIEAGALSNKLGYWLRYERTNGFSEFSGTSSKFGILSLGVSYLVKK